MHGARLTHSLVQRHIDVTCLQQLGHVKGAPFALHDKVEWHWLRAHWVTFHVGAPLRCLRQPLGRIRNYFGEQIALYFAWLQFYTEWLFYPSSVGLVPWSVGAIFGDPWVVAGGYFFSFFVMMWAAVYIEAWQSRNAFLNLWCVVLRTGPCCVRSLISQRLACDLCLCACLQVGHD